MKWANVETCEGCRLNYRTCYLTFNGVALKLSAMLDQVHDVRAGELVETKREEHVAGIQNAISRAFSRLAEDVNVYENFLAQSAGCPVCGLSEELGQQPLSMALFDAIENYEAAVNALREEITLLQARAPKRERGSGELFQR